MLDLFDQNGHLTDKALQALTWEEDLNELQRLEISEHLSFCDACTARYTDLLCDDILQAPPIPLYGEVMKKIREKERRLFLRRLTTVSAAACLALVFWWSGIFTFPSKQIEKNQRPEQTIQTDLEEQKPSGFKKIRRYNMGAKIYQNKKYIAFFLILAFVFMLIFLYYPFIQNIINSFQHIKYMGTAADKWNAPFYKN